MANKSVYKSRTPGTRNSTIDCGDYGVVQVDNDLIATGPEMAIGRLLKLDRIYETTIDDGTGKKAKPKTPENPESKPSTAHDESVIDEIRESYSKSQLRRANNEEIFALADKLGFDYDQDTTGGAMKARIIEVIFGDEED